MLNTKAHILFFNSLCRDHSSISPDCYCASCAKQHSWAERLSKLKKTKIPCMPGRIRSLDENQGKGNHLQFRRNLFTGGNNRSETFLSNPFCISKICLEDDLMSHQLLYFPFYLAAPCIKPPVLCCTLCTPSPVDLPGNAALAVRWYPMPFFCSYWLLRK